MQIFLDVRAERQERVKHLDLRCRALVVQFPVEHLQDQGQDRWQERSEFRVEGFTE